MNKTLTQRTLCCLAIFALVGSFCAPSHAQENAESGSSVGTATEQSDERPAKETNNDPYRLNEKPEVGKNIGVDSQNGEFILKDISFTDDENRFVEMGRYFDGKRPVMLSFNYSNCPKLCSVQLENMTWALRKVGFKVGKDFQVVSVSIDPLEQTARARQTKAIYTKIYNDKEAEDSFHFLTGKEKNIELLADICGFRYKYVKEQKLYSHPPVFILVSPNGKIVRYIHGLDYDPNTIEKALIESAEGKIGSPINLLAYGLGCFTYDPSSGKYTFQAMAIMRIGALITVALLLITLLPYWFFKRGNIDQEEKKKTGLPIPTGSSP